VNDARPAGPVGSIRSDLQLIADMIRPGTRVLDVGCGDCELLDYLVHHKRVDGRGIELSQAGVNAGVSRGLSIIQGDADTDLRDYPSGAFDYVVLTQTLPAIRDPDAVLRQLVRIARCAIVSIPNYGHWRFRLHLLLRGRMPTVPSLGSEWHRTPNIHPCTIADFLRLCATLDLVVERAVPLTRSSAGRPARLPLAFANFFAEQAIFVLGQGSSLQS